jgi:DNA mismatch endonuclease (patch repair protein)
MSYNEIRRESAMDTLTKERRSWNMSRIGGRNTEPEKIVRSILHRLGYRFRLHRRDLPGRPDIILPRHKIVVLVHGCFWHRHQRCKYAYTPKSNLAFWHTKFEGNVERDRLVRRQLKKAGWNVVVVWECQTYDAERLADCLARMLCSITQAKRGGMRYDAKRRTSGADANRRKRARGGRPLQGAT